MKMTLATYQAILRRNGAPFRSTGAGYTQYDFPLALGTPILTILLEDWVEFFQVEFPKTEEPLMAKASDIWEQYMNEVRNHIADTAPDIIPYLVDTARTMDGIETGMRDKIKGCIKTHRRYIHCLSSC
ncbi:hypothetical protein VTK26DRAFT_2516 [Humicola hyalothermophila]